MASGAVAVLVAAGAAALSAQTPTPAPAARFVVVLDAAHGGDDSGGRLASGQLEKVATLAFSVRLRSLLNARGIPVITTRESDIAIDPNRRAEMANHANAQACLTLHVAQSGSGIHLFTSSLPPSPPSRFIAWKTAQSELVTRSLALAGALNSALQQAGVNVTLSRTALLAVDSMTCPAAAVEIAPARGPDGKITSEPDDPDYLARIASTLADALLEWRTEARQQ
jgi:N-acetylmuramoyl-L-alanine amidase